MWLEALSRLQMGMFPLSFDSEFISPIVILSPCSPLFSCSHLFFKSFHTPFFFSFSLLFTLFSSNFFIISCLFLFPSSLYYLFYSISSSKCRMNPAFSFSLSIYHIDHSILSRFWHGKSLIYLCNCFSLFLVFFYYVCCSCILVAADYSQIEMRVMAQLCRDPNMMVLANYSGIDSFFPLIGMSIIEFVS